MPVELVAGALPNNLPWYVFAVPVLFGVAALALRSTSVTREAPAEDEIEARRPAEALAPVPPAEAGAPPSPESEAPVQPPAAPPEPADRPAEQPPVYVPLEPNARTMLSWPGAGLAGTCAFGLFVFFLATGQGLPETFASTIGFTLAVLLGGILERA